MPVFTKSELVQAVEGFKTSLERLIHVPGTLDADGIVAFALREKIVHPMIEKTQQPKTGAVQP